MQQEASTSPHVLLLLSNAVTAILAVVTTLTTLRFKQKREPVELRKMDAETHGLKVAADISPVGITLETLREIQSVIDKAEVRREAWLLKEEQLRTQIAFWRNKAEELDGELIDSREANGLLNIRLIHHENQEKKLKALLDLKGISYSEADRL
jgi:hypothetical protein